MKRIRCDVRGRVQSCGFRDFCWKCARKAGISGWAANDPACMTRVILELQGEADEIEKFLTLLRKGNGYCRVDTIERQEIEIVQGEKGFKAKRMP